MTPRHPHRTAALAAALLVGLAACGGSDDATPTSTPPTTAAAGPITAATPDEFVSVIGEPGITLIDVRTPEEFGTGHIAGAINIDVQAPDFADRIGTLPRDGAYAIYCHSGNRSGQAEAQMAAMGFTDMTDLTGGITAWMEAGMAVTAG